MSFWDELDRPVLESLGRRNRRDDYPNVSDLQEDIGGALANRVPESVRRVIEAGYANGVDVSSSGGYDVLDLRLTEVGLREIGDWPTASDADLAGGIMTPSQHRVIEPVLQDIRKALDAGQFDALDPEDRADVEAQLTTVEVQTRSPRARSWIVRASLAVILPLATGVGGNALYDGIRNALEVLT